MCWENQNWEKRAHTPYFLVAFVVISFGKAFDKPLVKGMDAKIVF